MRIVIDVEERSCARSTPAVAGLVALVAIAALAAGCGGPGYRVVRSDARVEYPEGPIGFDATALSGSSRASAMREALAASASRYRIVDAGQDGASPPFVIRVLALDETDDRVVARVSIVDGAGRVTSELEVEGDAGAAGDEAAAQLGERVAHYLRTRSDHHY